jgi:lipopolysaccharide export system permease protein
MNPLLRHVARTLFVHVSLALLAAVVLYLVVDFVEVGNMALERGQPDALSRLTWMNLPRVFRMMVPIAAPIGATSAIGALMRRREILALVAAGAPPRVLLRPVVGAGVVLAALHAANVEWLVPPASLEVAALRRQIGMAPGPLEGAGRKQSWFRGRSLVYRVGGLRNTAGGRVEGVLMLAIEDGRLRERWDVRAMRYGDGSRREAAEAHTWLGEEVLVRRFSGAGGLATSTSASIELPIQESPEDFVVSIASPERLGLVALVETAIARERVGRPARAHWLELHQRLAVPAAIVALFVASAGLALRLGRRQTMARALGAGALLGAATWSVGDFSVLFGLTGTLPSALAGWALPAGAAAIAAWLWRRVARVGIRDAD